MRTRQALLVVLAVAIVAALPGAAEARRAPQNFYGVSWDGSLNSRPEIDQDQQWDVMASSGVESTRVLFSWAASQPAPGAISFAYTDRMVARAARRRIQLLPVVFDAPPWAQLDPSKRNSPPRRVGEFAAYLRALVSHYGRSGVFWKAHPEIPKVPIREWQIWNEPELAFYWNVPPDWTAAWPKGYVKLLKASRKAIKSRDRSGKLVLGGLSEAPWKALRRLYKLKARRFFDVVAIHPYNSKVRSALQAARIVRATMRRYHDGRKPLWITELGWPAARGKLKLSRGLRRLATTNNGMASRVRTSYASFLSRRRDKRYAVSRLYWFTWASNYSPIGEGSLWNYAGLVTALPGVSFIPTPALDAYRASAQANQGCAKTSSGTCG